MNIEQEIFESINTMLYNSCAEHSCQCDINTIINIQNSDVNVLMITLMI